MTIGNKSIILMLIIGTQSGVFYFVDGDIVDTNRDRWAKPFYTSYAWIKCRRDYARSVNGLCERCLARGLYVPGDEVHHKIRLTPANVNDPAISLNWTNLELLCKDCHAAEHKAQERRWMIGKEGELTIVDG